MSMTHLGRPSVEFFNIYDKAPLPTPASEDLTGLMPARAAQLCLPIRSASGAGFYLYPPANFALRWDGSQTELSWLDHQARTEEWLPLDGGVEVYLPSSPKVPETASEVQQVDISRVMNPSKGVAFINAHPKKQNELELTTGIIARTSPGWGILVRDLINLPRNGGVEILDGFLETDWYRSFVPVIMRLTQPGKTVRFFKHMPLAHILPLPLVSLENDTPGEKISEGIANWPEHIWKEFVQTRSERFDPSRQRGTYMRAARRAATSNRCPFLEPTTSEGL